MRTGWSGIASGPWGAACLLGAACVGWRALDPANAFGLPVERTVSTSLLLLFVAAAGHVLVSASRTMAGRPAPWLVAAGLLPLLLLLSRNLRFTAHGTGFEWTTAYGPLTVQSALAMASQPLQVSLEATWGALALAGLAAAGLAVTATRGPIPTGLAAAGAGVATGLTSGCAACAPLLAAAGGWALQPLLDPSSPWSCALQLAVPLLALAPLTSGVQLRMPFRHALTGAAGVALLLPGMALAAAPTGASVRHDEISRLFLAALVAGGILTLLVIVLIIVFALRYREERLGRREPRMSRRGRFAWGAVFVLLPFVVIFSLGGASLSVLADLGRQPEQAMPVDVTATQFAWTFHYPDGSTTLNELRVPAGQAVALSVRSTDVIHSLFIPDMGVKIDANPGMTTHAWFQARHVGEYPIYCAQFCGVGHSDMRATLVVTETTA